MQPPAFRDISEAVSWALAGFLRGPVPPLPPSPKWKLWPVNPSAVFPPVLIVDLLVIPFLRDTDFPHRTWLRVLA